MSSAAKFHRRDIVFGSAAWFAGLSQSMFARAAVEDQTLNAKLAPVVVYLRIKKINAGNGTVYNIDCTGFLIGKDGWVLTAAHPISGAVLDANKKSIQTQALPEIYGSIGERREKELEELRAHTINDRTDTALLQFKNFSTPREKLAYGRSSNVNVGDDVFVSGFMYEDKPRATIKMSITSKGGASPLWNLSGEATRGLSGGPVVNRSGHLVAVFIGGDERRAGGAYALPINLARDYAGIAEATYADDDSSAALTSVNSGMAPKRYSHSFRAPPANEETIIRRPFVKAYHVPPAFNIVSASFSVERHEGLAEGPMVTITERNVIIAYSLESGPKSAGRIGWLEGAVTMDLVKK